MTKKMTIVDDFKNGNTILIFGSPFSKERNSIQDFEKEISSLRLMTYSEEIRFNEMLITDSGWGCSIRTAQMLFLNTLKQKINYSDNELLKHFIDNGDGEFNFLRVVLEGIHKFNQKIEKYWNFTAALKSFEVILNQMTSPPLRVMISEINLFEIKKIKKHFPSSNEPGRITPLMLSAIIVLLDDKEKITFMKEWMRCPYFCGMLFGKKDRAYYGFGFCEKLKVIYFMDPHKIKKVSKVSDFVCDHFPSIAVEETSESFVINLLLRDSHEFENLMNFFNKNVKSDQVVFQEEILNSEVEFHTNENNQVTSFVFDSILESYTPLQKNWVQNFTYDNMPALKTPRTSTQPNDINSSFTDANESKIFQVDQSCDEDQSSKIVDGKTSMAKLSKNKNQTLENSSYKIVPPKKDEKIEKNQASKVESNGRRSENLGKNDQSRFIANQPTSSNELQKQTDFSKSNNQDSSKDKLFFQNNTTSKSSNQGYYTTNFTTRTSDNSKAPNTTTAIKPQISIRTNKTEKQTSLKREVGRLRQSKDPHKDWR